MAYHLLVQTENRASPELMDVEPCIRLSPSQERQIVRHRLGLLPDRFHLSEADKARLSRRLITRRYAPGEIILRTGTRGDCLGLVTQGRVEAAPFPANGASPATQILPGDIFGEAMLATGQPCDRTLCAVIATRVQFLRRADLLAVAGQRQPVRQTLNRKRRMLAVAVVLLLLVATLLALNPTRQALALLPYSAGLWLDRPGHCGPAETLWLAARLLAPGWAVPHLALGNLHFRQGQFEPAQRELERALALMPDLAEAHNSLGLLYTARDEQAAAIEAFRRALELEPGQATIEANLAFSLQLAEQEGEALRHYALARSLDKPRPLLLVNEAIAHFEIGDLPAAEAAAQQALEMDAGLAPAHAVLGAVDLRREDPQEASLSLAEAIRLEPGYAPAHFYLGLAYKSLEQPAAAILAFERARALLAEPLARSEAQRHLSELYARSGSDGAPIQPYEGGEGR